MLGGRIEGSGGGDGAGPRLLADFGVVKADTDEILVFEVGIN